MQNSTIRTTEYGLTYQGQQMVGVVFASKAQAAEYVATAVAAGRDRADYGYLHRDVTRGPWASTTDHRDI